MKLMGNLRLIFVLALLFQLVAFPFHVKATETNKQASSWVTPVNYLALGDSLAFGIGPDGLPGKGYPDFLAETLDERDVLNSFNKGFTVSGYTAENVLDDLHNNVSKPIIGIGQEEKKLTLHESIEEADVITISVGANDILKYLKINIETGVPEIDLEGLMGGFQQLGVNYHKILSDIYQENPNAQVYVMGYYNPFPHLQATYQPQITQLLDQLNATIQSGMKGTNAVFVPTKDAIATDFSAYLPNPENIHLSEVGYQVVAQQFDEKLQENAPWIAPNTLTAEVKDHTTVVLNWKQAGDSTAIKAYNIYQGTEKIAEVNGNTTTFEVEDLVRDRAYTFKVSAVDTENQESLLNPVVNITLKSSAMFSDIENHWAKAFIEQAAIEKIMNGYTDGTFKPDSSLTRAQAASIIVRAFDLTATEAAPFNDINGYALETQAEIAAAYQYGIVKGSNGNFNPSAPVTRAQLALMVKRSYELATGQQFVVNELAPFPDIQNLDTETKTAITLLYQFDIISGSNGKYLPANPTTRAHTAKILINFQEHMKQGVLLAEQVN